MTSAGPNQYKGWQSFVFITFFAFCMLFSWMVPVQAADITDSIVLNESRGLYNRRTGEYSFDVSLQNASSSSFSSPIIVVISNISHPDVSVNNADGVDDAGNPFYDYSNLLGNGVLDPSETSQVKKWIFYNPKNVRFSYDIKVLSGSEQDDIDPPTISITNPVDNSVISTSAPLITIVYADADSDIDSDSLSVLINGTDATGNFMVTETSASYQLSLSLPSGANQVVATIEDNAGNQSSISSGFTVTSSSQPLKYLFSLKGNDWVFASSGDGTCIGYASPADLGLTTVSDLVSVSRLFPNGDLYFSKKDAGGILQSSMNGFFSSYLENTELGLMENARLYANHMALDGSVIFSVEGLPDIYQSFGTGSLESFIEKNQLGISSTDQLECLHIGYDDVIYFCYSSNNGIFQSSGTGTFSPFLTLSDLGVPGSSIDAFAIFPETTLPNIEITHPADGTIINTGTPEITIIFNDTQSGIDSSTLKVEINGVDSTSLFNVSESMANTNISPPLPIGNNNIKAEISDKLGNKTTAQSSFIVDVMEVTLNAAPVKGGVPLEVNFSVSVQGVFPPFQTSWDVNNDGITDDTRQTFNYIYREPGIYNVSVKVTDSQGKEKIKNITISAYAAPTVIASANPTIGLPPLPVSFSATVSASAAPIVLYEWDFNGDGIFEFSSGSTPNTQHTYTADGQYPATIRVTDSNGLTVASTVIIVIGVSPEAYATASVMSGETGLEVVFTGDGTDEDGTIVLFEWDFDGDGIYDYSHPSSGNASYTYNSPGVFNATFRVTDNDGLTDTYSILISIAGPPISLPRAYPTTGQAPLKVTFFSDGKDLDGSPEFFDWDFDGNGTRDIRLIASMNTTYTYNQPGTYNAKLTVIDNDGLSGEATITIVVTPPSNEQGIPSAKANATPSNGGAPLSVLLSATALDSGGSITKYEWDFEGDGDFDFVEMVQAGVPLGSIIDAGSYSTPELADIDNDGDLDLFIGESNGWIHFYRNDGNNELPVWSAVGYLNNSSGARIDVGSYSSPRLMDLDGDGDLDLLIGESGGRIYFYRNDGDANSPLWVAVDYLKNNNGAVIDVGSYSCPAFADIDNDGDLDLYVGESGGRIYFYRNDGDSVLPAWTPMGFLNNSNGEQITIGNYSTPFFIDSDGDGDLDLFIGASDGRIVHLQNTGNNFEAAWLSLGYIKNDFGTDLDVGSRSSPVIFQSGYELNMIIGESGGTLPYYVSSDDSPVQFKIKQLYLGYVGGLSYGAVVLADIDGDSDLDLFIGDANGMIYFYRNVGTKTSAIWSGEGLLTDENGIPIDVGSRSTIAFADTDADGDLDLYVGESGGGVYFYRNDGDLNLHSFTNVGFVENITGTKIDVGSYSSPAFGDIDNDGDLDLLVGESAGRVYLFLNSGSEFSPSWSAVGFIQNSAGNLIDAGSYSSPYLIDYDGDGDLDLFIGESGGRIQFFRNTGDLITAEWKPEGFISDSSGSQIDVGSYSIASFADMDGDSDIDYLISNSSGFVYFYGNSGNIYHSYNSPGSYEATLRVTNNEGLIALDSIMIEVYESGYPTASAIAEPESGLAPLTVIFKGQAHDPNGTIVLYQWDFDGDGIFDYSSTTSGDTSFNYANAGIFNAKYTVTDNEGNATSIIIPISVSPALSTTRTGIFNPVNGETAQITLTLTGETVLTIKVIDAYGNIIKTVVDNQARTTGTYTDTWDGTDEGNDLVRDGVYYFYIEYLENGIQKVFDLRDTATYGEITPSRSWPTTFNPFVNNMVNVTYSISKPSEVSMYFWKRDYTRPGSSIAPVRTLFVREPKGAGTHTEIWDGVDDKGAIVEPWSGGYPITLWVYELSDNAIVVKGNKPLISNVTVNPNYLSPAFNPYGVNNTTFTTVSFSLSKGANIEAKVINSEGAIVRYISKSNLPAGANTIIWDGKDYNDIIVPNGSYSISLTAIDNKGNRSLPRYSAIIIYY